MPIIGEAFIAVRPLLTGFGDATKAGINSEIAGEDLFSGVRTQSGAMAHTVEDDAARASGKLEQDMKGSTSKVGKLFDNLGNELSSWGIPFTKNLSKVGDGIDQATGKGKKLESTMATLGGVSLATGTIIGAGVAAESVHLAAGLQTADGQIASHEDISSKAAKNIGTAFTNTAFTTIYSANEMASAFAPVSGELKQIHGSALTAGQSLKFVADTGDLAEATGEQLGSTTSTVASIMQGFQIPLKGTTGLVNDLYNTSRITGTSVSSLGSTVDRLKARLGIAAPTVGQLSTLLVDLNEHGVQGSRGLQVVNTAVTTLLASVPKVSQAAAVAANSLSDSLQNAGESVTNAQTDLANAQANASTKVAAAQQKVVDVQDEIAASNTAAAPTTAQQISLQNAQTAVSTAQAAAAQSVAAATTKLTDAQTKAGQVTKTASVSQNQQVAVMQELGLQVYNSAGKFVGMDSIITQLQPKLASMTQQQQLFTLSQIFGSSASKALLDTVLAGPAAYNKAQKAVEDSSTAHAGAAKLNDTLEKELKLLRAGLVDEGDKIGLFLIPKLQDLGRWTKDDIQWASKHKDILYTVAGVIGGVLTLAIGTFVGKEGAKFVKFLGDGVTGLEKLSNKIFSTSFDVRTDAQKAADAAKASADQQVAATETSTKAYQTSADLITTSIDNLAGSIDSLAAKISGSLATVDDAFATTGDSATESDVIVERAMSGMSATVSENSKLIILANSRTAASFEEVSATSEETSLAMAKTSGLSDLRKAPASALEADAEEEAPAAGLGGAKSLLTSGGGIALGGLIGVQMYNSFAEKDVGKVIGTNAASTIGRAGTGAAIGAGIGSVIPGVGTALGAAAGAIIGAVGPKIGGDIASILHDHANEAEDAKENKRNQKIIDAAKKTDKQEGGSLSGETNQASLLQKQLSVLQTLQATVLTTGQTQGTSSSAYAAAIKNLSTTEQKWLPGLSKGVDLAKVSGVITATNAKLAAAQKTQSDDLKFGTMASSQQLLTGLQTTLSNEKAAGASESTLASTESQISETKEHIKDLKAISSKITKDTTTIQKADALKQEMESVNNEIAQVKNTIATKNPPNINSKGVVTLKVGK